MLKYFLRIVPYNDKFPYKVIREFCSKQHLKEKVNYNQALGCFEISYADISKYLNLTFPQNAEKIKSTFSFKIDDRTPVYWKMDNKAQKFMFWLE